ncbi:hypothetical protein [Bradyrhizobium sp. ORS 86]|uniref:hypothetical protein n=1 Tax=Bradyrhizobium sp. ORS 86 TaxID=1685970 RepID=UPI0038902C74
MTMTGQPNGRERLRHFASDLAKANAVAADLESLAGIIRDMDAAQAAVQGTIADDGGVSSLADYATGNAKDDKIAKLIANKEEATMAAALTRDALPGVQSMLENARGQVRELKRQRQDEVSRVCALAQTPSRSNAARRSTRAASCTISCRASPPRLVQRKQSATF